MKARKPIEGGGGSGEDEEADEIYTSILFAFCISLL